MSPQYAKPHLVLIKAQGLHELVVEQIQQMIIEGALAPGTRLNERLLCEKLGVSRTPLREALKILAALGLVKLLPNRGAAVVKLSAQDITETFEVISRLESMAGELACERITNPEIDEIRALHADMLACHARRDLPAYYRANQGIHDCINSAARNEVLRQMYATVNSRVKALRFSSNLDHERWDAAVGEHAQMIQALEARDGRRLAAILESHVLSKRDAALSTLRVSDERRENSAQH
jgi:DNA-binding GntR family transcriptional regulator